MGFLDIRNVTKSYGNVEVLHRVDIAVEEGEFLVLVGPSGCGKSTLLNMIAGLEGITGGEIAIKGRVVNGVHPSKRNIAMVFQSYALYPNMTVGQNMTFGLEMHGVPKPERDRALADVAKLLQIDHLLDRKPGQLSGGQRQRVALARVILKDAPILILDEATSALDSEAEALIQDALYGVMQGKTVIAIAHRLSTIAQMDRIVVLDQGRIAEQGAHAELLNAGGLYARFWARQSGGFIGSEEEVAE